MTKVSVVVATYKRDRDLSNALESLSCQKYDNMEIVLVDDNGNAEWNEKVNEIVKDFQTKYPKIDIKCIVNESNRGSAETRNVGIENSTGKYITFLDDDDVYLPEKISAQVEFMETNRLDYSITDLVLYNENGKLRGKRIRNYINETTKEELFKNHLKYHLTGTDTMMFTKDYLLKINGFAPIDIGDEFYLMCRAIDGNGKFGYLPRCDIKACVHTESGGLSSGENKIKGENDIYKYKKTLFARLDSKTRRYIRMRHYAVIAFAYLRIKKYGKFMTNSFKAFVSAPISCVKLLIKGH